MKGKIINDVYSMTKKGKLKFSRGQEVIVIRDEGTMLLIETRDKARYYERTENIYVPGTMRYTGENHDEVARFMKALFADNLGAGDSLNIETANAKYNVGINEWVFVDNDGNIIIKEKLL